MDSGKEQDCSPSAAATDEAASADDVKGKEDTRLEGDVEGEDTTAPVDVLGNNDPTMDGTVIDGEAGEGGKKDKKGVVYFSRIPPFMQPCKLRHLMEQLGRVGRVYLTPEDETQQARRKKSGGNKKTKFVDGWVEFESKSVAKRVAATLNNTPVGGKKRHNAYRDDMWLCRYLPKFKWHHLKEHVIYNREVRGARLEQKLSQQRKINNFYQEQLLEEKRMDKMKERREKKAAEHGEETAQPAHKKARTGVHQRTPHLASSQKSAAAVKSTTKQAEVSSDTLLDSLAL
ncbi:Activator of basal transcription 1 [Perkinsus olseni]|uniref:Activator of basal transcription 1 n=1 Tax=Perkinsus olseni TaxID=32597 RepID=A0A7J6R302_PEROL|nr:Activator of basal transcription 1 [Perkinsus olseni]